MFYRVSSQFDYYCLSIVLSWEMLFSCSGHQDVTEFMQTLTNSEQKTFLKGKSAHDDIEKWKSSSSFLLQPSSFVGKRMSDTKNFEDESKRKRA